MSSRTWSRRNLTLVCALLLASYGQAAEVDASPVEIRGGVAVTTAWTTVYNGAGGATGESPFGIAVGPDGNPAVAVRSNSTDIYVAKYNGSTGAVVWTRTDTGGAITTPRVIVANGNSDMIVGGQQGSITNAGPVIRQYAAATGTVSWTQTFAASSSLTNVVLGLDVGPSNTVAAASSVSTQTGANTRSFTSAGVQNFDVTVSGTSNTQVTDVAFDSSGNIISAGERNNGTNADCMVVKYNSAGTQQWNVTLTGDTAGTDRCVSVAVDASGDVFVAGRFNQTNASVASADAGVIKLNGSTGAEIWRRLINGAGNGLDQAFWIELSGNDPVITGHVTNAVPNRDMLTAKLNGSTGAVLWQQVFNGTNNSGDEGRTVVVDSNGGVYVAGTTGVNSAGPNFTDHYTAKYDGGNGTLIWDAQYDRAGRIDQAPQQGSPAIAVASPDNVFVVVDSTNAAGDQDTVTLKYTVPTAPEITVEQPLGTNLNDNGTRDFGSVNVGSNASLQFTIRNTGTANLTGLSILKDGTNAADYSITTPPNMPVTPGNSTTFTIQFAPSNTGTRTAALHIANNDSDENPFDINLTGTGVAASADVAITKTNGTTSSVPGQSTTYTITVSNSGPGPATGVTVTDSFPSSLSCSVTSVAAGGATGNQVTAVPTLNDSGITLPVGANVTYTAACAITAGATGNLVNTANVSASTSDPNSANNSATDTDTLVPSADVAITKTDGSTTEIPGTPVTYTIVASNSGPSTATGVTVTDTFPANLSGCSTSAVAAGGATGHAPGPVAGNISDSGIVLPPGASVTFTASCNIDAGATGSLTNTATITSAVTDPGGGNNSATDTDTLTPQADLTIVKNDGVASVNAGATTIYTITATNGGPSNTTATVTDTFPANCVSPTWTCSGIGGGTCTAGGSGNINTSNNVLPVGGSVIYMASCPVSPAATGMLTNTAMVSGAASDPVPGNNNATDTNTVNAQADLAISKTDNASTAVPGQTTLTYLITVDNLGPGAASNATVTDTLTTFCTNPVWSCTGANGATCTSNGVGNINTSNNNLPPGSSLTYTASCPVSAAATGTLTNTATVSSASDPNSTNNSDSDDTTLTPQADVSITKTDGSTTEVPGTPVSYTITASNVGPSVAAGVTVTDTFPAILGGCSTTSVAAGGASGHDPGPTAGNLSDSGITLPPGASVTYTASCNISAAATGVLTNTATIATATTDPTPGNNSATDTDTLVPSADLAISKTDGSTTEVPGTPVTYTITLSNVGPSNASGATVSDSFAAILSGCTTTSSAAGGATGNDTGPVLGNLNDTGITVPPGGSVTYTASCNIDGGATGSLVNIASVTASTADSNSGNNSASDTNTLIPSADVSITKTDGSTSEVPGTPVTYTIVASNAGPSAAAGVTVSDTFAAVLSGCSTTSVAAGGASGNETGPTAGNLNDTGIGLPAGGSVTYTSTCTISAAASGNLVNTATISTTTSDPNGGNNSATDSNTLVSLPVLSINDVSRNEGNSGSQSYSFTVSLNIPALAGGVSFDITTADNSANAPGDYVTRTLTSQTIGEGNSSYSFDVTVNGDNRVEANESFFVNLSNATGAVVGDGQGQGTLVNDDVAGVSVTVSGGSTDVTEAGNTDSYTVALTSQPAATVTVNLTGTQVSTSPTQLVFDSNNWNAAQTVTVTAIDDPVVEGAHSGSVTTAVSSSDPDYDARVVAPLPVNITDNDIASVSVTPTTGLQTTEAGGTASFTMVLTSQPSADVTIGLSSSDVSEGLVGPTSVVFTNGNWNMPRTVTVTGVDDALDDGDIAYNIVTAPASSGDTNYNNLAVADVAVSNLDNDSAPEFVAGAAISRQRGSAASLGTIGTVNDAQDPAASLMVTQVAGGSATGISSTAISNTAGQVSAQFAASCTASAGTVRFQVADSGGLTATADLQVNVTANTPPSLAYAAASLPPGTGLVINPNAAPTDNGSITSISLFSAGTYTGQVTVNNAGVITLANAQPVGTHTLTIRATDDCGDFRDVQLPVTVNQVATFKLLTANVSPSRFGQAVTFSAELSGLNPSGSVEFFAGTTSLGTVALVPSPSGGANLKLANLTLSTLATGTAQISVRYPGDPQNLPSVSPDLPHTVLAAGTRITLTPATNPAAVGNLLIGVQVAAEAPGGGIPAGQVNLSSGASNCVATLNAAGAGSCALNFSTTGFKAISASYVPSGGNHLASTGGTAVAVVAAPGSTDLRVRIGNGLSIVDPGQPLSYMVIVDNLGSEPAVGRLEVPLSSDFTSASYTCLSAGEAVCGPPGSGSIDRDVTLGPGGTVIYTFSVSAPLPPEHPISQLARISTRAPTTDPDLSNNEAIDTDFMGLFADGLEGPNPAE